MLERKIIEVQSPQAKPGFLGQGHLARMVVGGDFAKTDPFIFLMDDMLDKRDNSPVGGPHPHAGFETVSLMIDGEFREMLESMSKGDFQVMTAGSGVVHTETMDQPTKGRLFQMWLNLPAKDRWVEPRLQILGADKVPVINKEGYSIRLYSGTIENISSPIENYTPLIAAEIEFSPGAQATIPLPSYYNSFFFVIEGLVTVAERQIEKDQVAWLDLPGKKEQSFVNIKAGQEGARLVLYAARPTGDDIVSHGPFIAGNRDEIVKLFKDYNNGQMQHISHASEEQKLIF